MEKREEARVRISKARTSAKTIRRPGRARRIMGSQFEKARRVRPGQQIRPEMKRTYRRRSRGRRLSVIATAMGAPIKPHLKCYESGQK